MLSKAYLTAAALSSVVAAADTFTYTTVPGYFLQDAASTNATGFDYTAVNFGLINQTYPGIDSTSLTQWQQFERVVETLNAGAPLDTTYKLFWLGRHGEGYHNAAESFYGTPAWNCYWSELDGNGTATWADADLTANGIKQAQIANAFWKSRIAVQKIPYPQSYYTSPLTRCLRTANLTFSDIPLPYYYEFVPTVKEFFREGISTHTCDRRGTKTNIHQRFPTYEFEHGFTETDELWNINYAETSYAQDIRSKAALDSVFSNDDHTWISVTSHSGEIGSLLRVLGHRTFSLSTGAIIPVLVKAQLIDDDAAKASSSSVTSALRTSSRYCNAPPITSIATGTQGCVCSAAASTGVLSTKRPSASASLSRVSGSVRSSPKATAASSVQTSIKATVSSHVTATIKTTSASAAKASKSACKAKKGKKTKRNDA